MYVTVLGMVSRRERPAKPALSREKIVAAAAAILRTEGLDRVTMRRLAKDLDTGPMSLYVYVRDTDELHAAVLDELLAEVDLAAAADDWTDRLWSVLRSYIDVLARQPGLAKLALVTRLSGPRYLALVETVLALLRAGGVQPAQAAWGVDLLLQFATSTAIEYGTRQSATDHEALVRAIETADAADYPTIAELRSPLLSGHGRWRWHYDALLTGIRTVPLEESDDRHR